ncbi:DUF1206 domain-containing protein [Nocardioides sp. GY 10127]|uniref:DUF1206 domain-containing protein n=1 Tax=Nocardioides sp. GY 10127 TaxID=2569762 RepID=UPI0010A8690E|nr:DUF1206 domain-containing protein [Nocardioides sp. GY 10127]TIC85473.1 DUF1206 domain-containing protein [Nocardioides sp. GY 10127]
MTSLTDSVPSARDLKPSDGALHTAGRVGMAAYGVVYVLVGWLALQLALGDGGGSTASSTGALHQLAEQPLGAALVWAVAVGLILLVVWQAGTAIWGYADEDGKERLAHRAKSAARAVVYAAIAVSAIQVAVADSSGSGQKSGGGSSTSSWTATLMSAPAGQLLVGAVGLFIVGLGIYYVVKAYTERFRKELDAEGSSGSSGRAFLLLGKIGYTARGIAFAVVGGLFVWAAATHSAKKSGGLDHALLTLRDAPAGPWLLGAVAVGIACYGVFCLARAKHLSQ